MKRAIKASPESSTNYKVFFNDSNQMLLEGPSITAIVEYIESKGRYTENDIVKIIDLDYYNHD